jgi:hypothetical protein
MGDIVKEWPTHSSPPKKYTKKLTYLRYLRDGFEFAEILPLISQVLYFIRLGKSSELFDAISATARRGSI